MFEYLFNECYRMKTSHKILVRAIKSVVLFFMAIVDSKRLNNGDLNSRGEY